VEVRLQFAEKILKHRKLAAGSVVFLIIILIVSFILWSGSSLEKVSGTLDEELGQRLYAISLLTAHLIEAQFGAAAKDQLDFYGFELKTILNSVKEENQLQAVFLIDENYNVLADDNLRFKLPEKRTYVQDDSLCLKSAWKGVTVASPLHIVQGNHFKSAYAPVINDDQEIMALLVVEASANFFDNLQAFNQSLMIAGIFSLIIILLLAVFLYWAFTVLLKSFEIMRRSERLALMGQMAASMAHEIRNPLGIMKGTADVLRELYDNPEKPNELFDFIPYEIKRLNRLVNDFLTFARGVKLDKRSGNIQDIILQVEKDISREQPNPQIQIISRIAADLPTFEFDADAMYRVIYNLALNSIQAMEKGGALTLQAQKTIEKEKSHICIEIIDTGCGIAGNLEKIFDPFYTTKTKGTGLGLAITQQIVENHGGWIYAESKVNEGTKMTFYLPF
jgi:signal transduction histidine kinase